MSKLTDKEIAVAIRYVPEPYWGCPNCGANTWGAINPMSDEDKVYRCHGPTVMGNPFVTLEGCGTLFKLPPKAHKEVSDVEAD